MIYKDNHFYDVVNVVLHKATLRLAHEGEIDAIQRFVREFKTKDPEGGKHIANRPPEEYLRAVDHHLVFVIEMEGQLVALSGAFDVPMREDPDYVEFGSTAITRSLQGFGLQKLFGRLRIASIVTTDLSILIATVIDPENTKSTKSMTGLGFTRRTEEVPESAFEPCIGCDKRERLAEGTRCCSHFLELPRGAVPPLVGELYDKITQHIPKDLPPEILNGSTALDAPIIALARDKREGEYEAGRLELTVDCPIVRNLERLRDLAMISDRRVPWPSPKIE